jgi:hypothetical protein
VPVKNLYVKAKKEKEAGDSRTWLVVAAHDTKVRRSANGTAMVTMMGAPAPRPRQSLR